MRPAPLRGIIQSPPRLPAIGAVYQPSATLCPREPGAIRTDPCASVRAAAPPEKDASRSPARKKKNAIMEPYAAGWLSLVPPIVAIVLALLTKEVLSSLLIGILTGTLIYTIGTGGNVIMDTLQTTFTLMGNKLDFNILIFCSLLGALIYVITLAGGTHAYGKAATRLIKGRRSTLTATSGLGIAIFIDDYFNCLTVGTVMRPLTDLYRISREKLAYIIDSTAAPICIIAPISSWAAAVGSSLKSTGAFESELGAFVSTIPWNFYALLSLVLVGFICTTNFDFGPMRRAELRAQKGELSDEAATVERKEPPSNPRGTVWDMLVPLAALIICAVLALMYSGGYWGEDAKYHTFMAAIGNSSASISLVWASFSAIVVALLMFVPRRLVTFSEFMNGAVEGMKMMLPANIILILAWTLSGVCRDLLQAPQFMEGVVTSSGMSAMLLPVLVFTIAAFLSFSMGTAWGTFGILIPIVVPIVQALDPQLTVVVLSATLAGSVFGDHCSPISDTTILSSAGSRCRHIDHVSTQLPYSLLAAVSAGVGYLVAGVTGANLFASLGAALVTLIGATTVLHFWSQKREPDAA